MASILIVDNQEQTADLMTRCLSDSDLEIFTAISGNTAFNKAMAFKPDLIILDTELRDMSGYELCKRLKTNPDTKFIPILFVSISDTNEFRLRALQMGADDYIEKNFDATLLKSKVKSLLRVKNLSDQLVLKYAELEEKNSILDFQLKMSRRVQRSLIPEVDIKFNRVKVISKYMPALDIGGDFYDVITLDNETICVIMGDVSGHGIAAALLTAMLNMMIKNLVKSAAMPNVLLEEMNKNFYQIFSMNHEMYACVFYAMINTARKKIYYSNAGQTLPIYVNSRTNTAKELEISGTPIGMLPDSTYECKVLNYNEGDLVFFHTDGLCDTFYKDNPDVFSSKLKETLLDTKSLEDLNETIDIVLSSFYNFQASDAQKYELDDVSVILCKM